MRNLRALALWGMGVVSAMTLGACAAEVQEPSATDSGGAPGDLTSDSGSETTTSANTSSSITSTTTSSGNPSSANTASVTTDGASSSTETSSSVTTGSQPLGGTVTSSNTSSSTNGGPSTAAVTGTSVSSTSGSTTSGSTTTGFGGFGGGNGVSETTTANTTTGGGSCDTTPATAPVPLEPTDGWVDCSTNAIGIQGTFFTYEDGNGSSITPSFSGDEICVEGTAGQIVGGDNATWGAGVGVNLNQDDPEGDVNPWNASAMGISGFRFNLSAMPAGTGLRLVYQNDGTDYCVDVTEAGLQTVFFEDTAEACWSAGGGPPSGTMLEAVKWQVTTNATSDHDFAFCISGLAAVP